MYSVMSAPLTNQILNLMKNMFTKISLLLLALLSFSSCDNDDYSEDAIEIATCDDGIMNGTETGVDCGGSCAPCAVPVTPGRRAELYVTNTNSADPSIFKYSISGDSLVTFTTTSTDAEGIYYDANSDLLVQASAMPTGVLQAFSGTSTLDTSTLTSSFTSSADLTAPREIAVIGNNYVVSDNTNNTFYVYTLNGSSFSLSATVDIQFPVWGIAFRGNDLYAVVDGPGSNELAVFEDFITNATTGTLNPSKRVTIEGIVRTHGLTYDGTDDVLIMTDIGSAADANNDGGFHVIADFSTKFDALSDGEVLPLSMQIRVAGSNTTMGNPIDVAYDSETDAIYISEVGNGKVLGFTDIGSGGNISPSFSKDLAGASSIYFSSDETDGQTGMESMTKTTNLYATSTADGNITVYNGSGSLINTIMSGATGAEGIYYSALQDILIQGARTPTAGLQYFDMFSTAGANTTADFTAVANSNLTSPREIAVYGNKVVVSDNVSGMLLVYSYSGSSFTLVNSFTPDFVDLTGTLRSVWGITFKGNDLLAVIDGPGSNQLAIYEDFLTANTTNGSISATKTIGISGIVRTHGIDYSEADDVLVMTNIGLAAGGALDGGIHVVQNFSALLANTANGGTIATSNQTIIQGAATLMNNPIDVAYDSKTKTVFVADVAQGAIYGYTNALTQGANIAPSINNTLTAAASIYLYNN
tara:strand:- start:212 stop:2311 length:2100 start_codon:yes stop_codon:yes gene_type:complete